MTKQTELERLQAEYKASRAEYKASRAALAAAEAEEASAWEVARDAEAAWAAATALAAEGEK